MNFLEFSKMTETEQAYWSFPPEHIPLTPPDMNPCPECKTELEMFEHTVWYGGVPELGADIVCPNPMCNFKDEM